MNRLLYQLTGQDIKNVVILIIVVIDGSTDGTEEMILNEFPGVRTVQGSGNWWFTKCLNEGCKLSLTFNPDFIIAMNDDTEVEPDFIRKLIDIYNKLDDNCLLGSICLSISEPNLVTFSGVQKIIRWRLKKVNYTENFLPYDSTKMKGTHLTQSLLTRGMLIPVNILYKLKFFDEIFPQYGSDEDFCLRAIKQGFRAYISWDVKVYENVKLTSKGTAYNRPSFAEFINSLFNKYSVNSLSKNIKFYWRHGIPVLLPVYLIILIIGTLKAQIWNYRKIKI